MAKQVIPNLVPPAHELKAAEDITSPIEVLKIQAKHWTEQTGGEVVGEVEPTTQSAPNRFAYWFGFVVPALNGYRYRLFLVEHGLEFYPLLIARKRGDGDAVEVEDEEQYYNELHKRFSAAETLAVVRKLRALVAENRAAAQAKG